MSGAREPLLVRWRRFRNLPPFERSVVIRAMTFLPLTRAALRVMGFKRWKQLTELLFGVSQQALTMDPSAQLQFAEKIARAAGKAERYSPRTPNCLERSLTLWWLLRREGIDGELHIGARKSESGFEAHAWVEWKGIVLNDSADIHKHYSRFDAPIAAQMENPR